jgi:hypothetical protein
MAFMRRLFGLPLGFIGLHQLPHLEGRGRGGLTDTQCRWLYLLRCLLMAIRLIAALQPKVVVTESKHVHRAALCNFDVIEISSLHSGGGPTMLLWCGSCCAVQQCNGHPFFLVGNFDLAYCAHLGQCLPMVDAYMLTMLLTIAFKFNLLLPVIGKDTAPE